MARKDEVRTWVAAAQKVVERKKEPSLRTGGHCAKPFECGFLSYCRSQEPQAKHPASWLPNVSTKALKSHIEANAVIDLREVPDHLLNEKQLRVKKHTLSGKVYFDAKGAKADREPALVSHPNPQAQACTKGA